MFVLRRLYVCEREIESVCFEQTLMSEKTACDKDSVRVCLSVCVCECVGHMVCM